VGGRTRKAATATPAPMAIAEDMFLLFGAWVEPEGCGCGVSLGEAARQRARGWWLTMAMMHFLSGRIAMEW
jgi:hypothetical protein